MKKIYLSVLIISTCLLSVGQNSLVRDNEFTINPYTISPSFSGFNTNHEIFASYINHFSGIKGAPHSAWINYNGIAKDNFGIGGAFRYEKFGAFRNIRADISSAYHLKIQTDHRLSVGIGFSVTQTSLDFSNSNSDPLNDVSLNSSDIKNGVGINAAFGITYAWKALNISFAAPGFVPLKMNDKLFLYSQPVHLRAHIAYDVVVNRHWSVKPQAILDYVLNAPVNYNVVIGVKYNNLIWIILGYGAQNIISAALGASVAQRFAIQYTFKYGLNGIARSPFGSHEICLGVRIGKLKKQTIHNSIFYGYAKSPYHDWE